MTVPNRGFVALPSVWASIRPGRGIRTRGKHAGLRRSHAPFPSNKQHLQAILFDSSLDSLLLISERLQTDRLPQSAHISQDRRLPRWSSQAGRDISQLVDEFGGPALHGLFQRCQWIWRQHTADSELLASMSWQAEMTFSTTCLIARGSPARPADPQAAGRSLYSRAVTEMMRDEKAVYFSCAQ